MLGLAYLINSGADIESCSIEGWTALHEAASTGQEAVCRALLKHDANTSRKDSEFHTAADIASIHDFPELESLLKPPVSHQVGLSQLYVQGLVF